MYQHGDGLPGGPGDVGGDDISGMAVQRGARRVIPHRAPRISVGCGFLDIPQRDLGIETGGDKRVAQRVRLDRLGDPGPAAHPPDDPPGIVPVQPAPIGGQEDRPAGALTNDRSPRRCAARAGRVTTFPPFRVTTSVRWPRSMPRTSISAPVASETRSPFRASSEISACSAGGPSPAATRRAEFVAIQASGV